MKFILKTSFLYFIYMLSISFSSAQAPDFEDLLILYSEDRYEKCYSKAIKYTENDNTRKEPMPYLYVSMAMFEISKDEKYKKSFPKAFKDALGYAAKFKKKDKTDIFTKESERYYTKLKKVVVEDTENFFIQGNYKKAISNLNKLVIFDPQDIGGWVLKGVCNYNLKVRATAVKDFEEAKILLDQLNLDQFKTMSTAERRLMMFAIMKRAEMYYDTNNYEDATSVINSAYQYFQEDLTNESYKEYRDIYHKIING